jgi:hypothetical protein
MAQQQPQLSAAEAARLVDLYQKIDGLSASAAKNAADFANQQGRALKELTRLEKEWSDLTKNIAGTREAFANIVDEIKGMSSGIGRATTAFKGLESLASKLQYHQQGINRLSSKELENLKKKTQQKIADLKLASDIEKSELARLLLKQRKQGLDAKETEKLHQVKTSLNNINQQLFANVSAAKDFDYQLTDAIKKTKEIEKTLGLTGALIKGIQKIPFLGNLPGMEKVLGNVEEKIVKIQEETGETVSKTKAMGMAFGEMGKVLGASLTDPFVIISLLVKGFKMLLEIGFKVDKQVTALSRSLAISKGEAEMMRDRFVEIQNSEQSIYETTENLVSAQLELGKAFGATRGFTEQQLKDQVLLTKQMGLEEEAAAGLQQLALANGITADDVLASTIKQTASLAKQTGIQLDNKKVLNEVAKVSGQLRLQYKNNPELIAKAVVQTEKLGISLEKAKGMANSLLQFEDSISAELEAELLTGKQINLEQARLLALNGKTAEAAAEISRQIGTSAEYSAMNVLQQDAYARALGMSADELANMLLYNENINKLGANTKSQIEEQIKLAKEKGDTEKVQMLERSIGNEGEALAALKSIEAQDKFNQAVEKLKSMLSDLVAGPAMDLVNGLANMLSSTENIKKAFGGIAKIIGGISLAKMIGQTLILAAAQAMVAAGAITTASAITLGIGIAAVLAGMAIASSGFDDISSSMESKANKVKVSDAQIASDGGLIVSGKKGTYQLDANDTVVAGTDLDKSKGNKKDKGGEPNIIVRGGETSLTIDGVAFARLITPFIIEEQRKLSAQLQ